MKLKLNDTNSYFYEIYRNYVVITSKLIETTQFQIRQLLDLEKHFIGCAINW